MPSENRKYRAFSKLLIITALMFLFLFVLAAREEKDESFSNDDIARLKYENQILDTKVQLAKSGKLYLIADLPARKIHLMIRGVSLKAFPLENITIGRRAIFFVPISSELSFKSLFTDGVISPTRVVERYQIVPPAPEEVARREKMNEEEVPPPATPESKQIDVPHIFKLIFKEGFAVEVVSMGVDKESPGFFERLKARLKAKLSDIASIFRKGKDVKLRVSMKTDDFRFFYRVVPDPVSMIVIIKPLNI